MKSDPLALRRERALPAADPLLHALAAPAARLAPDLTLQDANAPLARWCEQAGGSLAALEAQLARVPPLTDGEVRAVRLALGGQALAVTLSRQGACVALLGAAEDRDQGGSEATLLALGRRVAGAAGEEDLVAAVAWGVRELFPGRRFCVRLVDPKTGALSSLYAEGRLGGEVREPLVLAREAAERAGLALGALPPGRVAVQDPVPLLFADAHAGQTAPLAVGGQLFGAITLEYPAGLEGERERDAWLLEQAAQQVAVAVKNAKLIDELVFVRGWLEELLERANALIVVVDRDFKVRVVNQALRELIGYTPDEVLGRPVVDFLPEDEAARVLPMIAGVLQGEWVERVEVRLKGKHGEVRALFAPASMRTPQGEVEGLVAIGQDLTGMKRLERQVVQAEKLASLGRVAASVVHEINNPMTAVTAYAQALLDGARTRPDGGGAEAEKLARIVENGQRVLRFTRDLVSYARPARDLPELLSLDEVVERALGYCEHVVRQAGVTLTREPSPGLPRLRGVRQNLVQVLVNLVTNACHATAPGGQVRVRTRRDGSHLVLEVEDTGQGIRPEDLPHIFEPFFTTKTEGRGTGLGLSIVQGIVESHGGSVTVDSRPGEGSCFHVRLPLPEQTR